MFTLVITLIVIVASLLVLVVLAQNSKGGGLSSQFGGSGSQLMGVKRTTDLLEKITWGLAIALVVLTLSTNFLINDEVGNSGINSPNIDRAQEQTIFPGMNNNLGGEGAGENGLSDTTDIEGLGN
jgi:preprotein translocase subunit SecG